MQKVCFWTEFDLIGQNLVPTILYFRMCSTGPAWLPLRVRVSVLKKWKTLPLTTVWWRPTRGKLFQCRCKTNKKTTDNIVGQLWNCRHNKLKIADAEGNLQPKIANKNHNPTNFFMRGRTTNEHHKIWLKHKWDLFGKTI